MAAISAAGRLWDFEEPETQPEQQPQPQPQHQPEQQSLPQPQPQPQSQPEQQPQPQPTVSRKFFSSLSLNRNMLMGLYHRDTVGPSSNAAHIRAD